MPYRINGSESHEVSGTILAVAADINEYNAKRFNSLERKKIIASYDNGELIHSKNLGSMINIAHALVHNSFVFWDQAVMRMFNLEMIPVPGSWDEWTGRYTASRYPYEKNDKSQKVAREDALYYFREKYGPDKNVYAEHQNVYNPSTLRPDNREPIRYLYE